MLADFLGTDPRPRQAHTSQIPVCGVERRSFRGMDGKPHAVQPQELYRSQQYGTAVYQSDLAMRLKALGYEIEQGKNGAPEIKG